MQDKSKRSASYKRIRKRNFVTGFFAVVLFLTVCLFTPLFDITSISVKGNKLLSDKEIIDASGIKKGDNLFRINTKKGKANINALGYVDSVNISRKFFSRVEIEVTECEEKAYILFSGNYVGIGADGKAVSITKQSKMRPKKAVISGCKLTGVKKGEIIEAKNEKIKTACLTLIKALDDNGFMDSVKKIDVANIKKISFTLSSDTKIFMGDTTEADYKLKCLGAVLGELGDVRGGEIDVSDPANIVYKGGN